MNDPTDVAVDPSGNIFIADRFNGRIRKVTASTGIITTIAGTGFTVDLFKASAVATKYRLFYPDGVTLDTAGNVYIAGGLFDPCIFKITVSTGNISIVAGLGPVRRGRSGYNGDDILATAAKLNIPTKVVFDASGNMYISDSLNCRIRKVTASTGMITTVAGTGAIPSVVASYNGEGGLATAASIHTAGLAIDTAGNLYFATKFGNTVRKVTFNGATPSISVTPAPSVKGAPSSPPSAPAVASTPTASAPTPGASSSSSKAPVAPSSTATQSSSTTHFAQTIHLTIIFLSSLLILLLCRDA